MQAMKLLSLRFFGFSQTSMRQANIFASGVDLSHQLDQFALSRAVEVRNTHETSACARRLPELRLRWACYFGLRIQKDY